MVAEWTRPNGVLSLIRVAQNPGQIPQSYYNWNFVVVGLFHIYSAVYRPTGPMVIIL